MQKNKKNDNMQTQEAGNVTINGNGNYPKKYLITSAQGCYHLNKGGDDEPYGGGNVKAKPHSVLLKGFENYAKENGAELIIVPIAGKNTLENILHEEFQGRKEIFRGTVLRFNKNLQFRDLVVPPQNVDPVTGKSNLISKYNSSIIFAHSKQRFSPVPVFNADLPRYLYTTGAVTEPNYNTANHRGDTAMRNHVFGGVVVEVLDDTYYNIRNVRGMMNGKFVDLGKLYDGKHKPKKIGVDSLVLGDIHWGDHDDKSIKANYEMIEFFKPKRIFLHDFFNGHSVNHHELDNFSLRSRELRRGRLDLLGELESDYIELKNICNLAGEKTEINLVSSNHHQFLTKYINSDLWMKGDLWNSEIGGYLFSKVSSIEEHENEIDSAAYLLEEGFKRFGPIPSNVKFLRYKDNYRRYGFQLASHGDKGKSGSRGGDVKSRSVTGGGKSITGHSHAMSIFGDTYIVGTSTKLDLPYTLGYGNASIAANAILYDNGTVQMIPIIKGKWKAD